MNREEKTSTALSTHVVRESKRESVLLSSLRAGLRLRAQRNGEVLIDLLVGVFACLFAGTHALFGVYPFSLGLLFAASSRLLPIFVGALVGCALMGPLGTLYLILHILAFSLRLCVSFVRVRQERATAYFAESPAARALSGAAIGLCMALYELILFGVESYTLLFAAGAVLLLPLTTLGFSFATAQGWSIRTLFGRDGAGESAFSPRFAPLLLSVGGVFLFFVAALSLRPYSLFGISLTGCAVTALTLFVSRRFGAARGCAAGLLIGLAGEAAYLPAYGLLGLLSGLYAGIGMPLSLAAAVLSGGGYAVYVGGLTGFLSVVPEMAVTSLLLCVPLRYVSGTAGAASAPPPKRKKELGEGGEEAALACLSGALSRVSDELKQAAKNEKNPTPEEYEAICRAAREKICLRCPAQGRCGEYDAVSDALRSAVIRLSIGEGLTGPKTPPCEGYEKMADEIRREAAKLSSRRRLGGAKGALSVDHALIAQMMEEAARERAGRAARDTAAEEALADALFTEGISAKEIVLTGNREKRLLLQDLRAERARTVECERVRSAVVRACGGSLRELSFFHEGGVLSARAESRLCFSVEGATYTAEGKTGECAADRALLLTGEDGMTYALLCDGMGSGARAASTASLGVSVLSTLLSAGVSRQLALGMLNNLICTGEEECSVALDLLSFDRYSGRVGFLKSGAAASFVWRDGALFRIRSRTIPLGLLRVVDSEEASFEVREGDVLVLLSDGVLGESEDGAFLKEILAAGGTSEALAARIVGTARTRGVSEDDKTAIVLRVLPPKDGE
ncbi:MAG: SpoIIE family protein phosphatase [Clostridia bacterium]|nr:SpoIIE family protein phosphatase [Clostridia bacterium]